MPDASINSEVFNEDTFNPSATTTTPAPIPVVVTGHEINTHAFNTDVFNAAPETSSGASSVGSFVACWSTGIGGGIL